MLWLSVILMELLSLYWKENKFFHGSVILMDNLRIPVLQTWKDSKKSFIYTLILKDVACTLCAFYTQTRASSIIVWGFNNRREVRMSMMWQNCGLHRDFQWMCRQEAHMQTLVNELFDMAVFKEIIEEKQLGFTDMKYPYSNKGSQIWEARTHLVFGGARNVHGVDLESFNRKIRNGWLGPEHGGLPQSPR